MRKLATIEEIKSVESLVNADALDLVRVRGWKVVTKKNEFKVGDLALYFEIDSFLPVRPEFEFLRKSSFKKMGEKEGFRLKTIKLRGQVSQGLVLPVSAFPELQNHSQEIGKDVTDLLGIEKYEPPIPQSLSGVMKGAFPGKIRKTDQERIQNLWEEYSVIYKDLAFEETIKLDGTSMTVYFLDNEVGVCSRNLDLKETSNNVLWNTALKLNLPEILAKQGRNLAIQGELIGPGIQRNNEKLSEVAWFVFDIWDIDKQQYLTALERNLLCQYFNLLQVPIASASIKVFQEFSTLDELLAHASGNSLNAPSREGLVYKSLEFVDGEIISFKVISNQWLLKAK